MSQARALAKDDGDQEASPQLHQWMVQQTQKARLVAYLGRHDPIGLMQAMALWTLPVEELLRFFCSSCKRERVMSRGGLAGLRCMLRSI